jgi:hypothetical protein
MSDIIMEHSTSPGGRSTWIREHSTMFNSLKQFETVSVRVWLKKRVYHLWEKHSFIIRKCPYLSLVSINRKLALRNHISVKPLVKP